MLRDAERYLYHYTRASTLTEFILPQRRLRLSSFQTLNDPKEAMDFQVSGGAWGDDLPVGILDDFSARLKQHWRIACFSSDPAEAAFGGNDLLGASQLQKMHERGHSRPRMWAQYAENHSGACVVVDKLALSAAFETLASKLGFDVFSGPICYQNMPIAQSTGPFMADMNDVRRYGVQAAATKHGLRFWRRLFLTKNTDWSAEREFRWLMHGKRDGEVFVDLTNCLRGVLLGQNFPDRLLPETQRLAAQLGIELARMDWKNGIPQIRTMFLSASGDWIAA
jgi:hypothetical protein